MFEGARIANGGALPGGVCVGGDVRARRPRTQAVRAFGAGAIC